MYSYRHTTYAVIYQFFFFFFPEGNLLQKQLPLQLNPYDTLQQEVLQTHHFESLILLLRSYGFSPISMYFQIMEISLKIQLDYIVIQMEKS